MISYVRCTILRYTRYISDFYFYATILLVWGMSKGEQLVRHISSECEFMSLIYSSKLY